MTSAEDEAIEAANGCEMCGCGLDEESGANAVSGVGVLCDACERREFGPFDDRAQ